MQALLRLVLSVIKSVLRMALGLILSIALAAGTLYFVFAVQSPDSPASRWFWPKVQVIFQQPAVQKVTTQIAKAFGGFATAGLANERQTEPSKKSTGQKPVGSKAKATPRTETASTTKAVSAQSVSEESVKNIDGMAQEMFKLVNQARAEAGREPLKWDPFLANVAEIRARDMINKNYFDHYVAVDGKLKSLAAIEAKKLSPSFDKIVGENLYKGTSDAKGAFNALMNSPGHRKNILNSKWKSIGIAFVKGAPTCNSPPPFDNPNYAMAHEHTCVQIFSD